MSQKKRNRKKAKGRRHHQKTRMMQSGPLTVEQSGANLSMRMDPMSDEEFAEYRKKTEEWLGQLPETIETLRGEVRGLVEPFDAFDLISNLWFANAPYDPNNYRESSHDGLTTIPEYVASLCLERKTRDGSQERPPLIDARVVGPINEKVREILLLTHLQIHHGVISAPGDETPEFRELRSRIITRELSVQGPGFDFQELDALRALFGPDQTEAALRDKVGFSAEDAIVLSETLSQLAIERLRDRTAKGREFEREVLTFLDGPVREEGDQLEEAFAHLRELSKADRKKYVQNYAVGWSFFALGTTASVTAPDLAKAAGVAEDTATAFLAHFSLDFGRTPEASLPAEFQKLRERPILHDGAGNYLVTSALSLFWAVRPLLEAGLRSGGGKAAQKYSDARGAFVEERALRYLQGALPGADVFPSVYYEVEENGETRRYETDGVIVYDSVVLIVEGKAGSVTPPGRRGAPDRLKKHLGQIIVEAAEQAERTSKALADPDVRFTDDSGNKLELPRDPTRVFPIVVTLDDLSGVTSTIWELAADGLLPDEVPTPWALSLFELELICELVDYGAQFIHFLTRRARLNELRRVVAFDELDWWMFYLLRGLYFDDQLEAPDAPTVIHLLSFTDDLDAYFLWKRGPRTKKAKKPRQKLHHELEQMLRFLHEEQPPGFVEAGVALLEMGEEGRRNLVTGFRRLRTMTERDGKFHDLSLLVAGPGSLGITFMCAPGSDAEALSERLRTYCAAKKYQSQLSRWVGLGWCAGTKQRFDSGVIFVGEWEFDSELEELLNRLGLAPTAPVERSPGKANAWKTLPGRFRMPPKKN